MFILNDVDLISVLESTCANNLTCASESECNRSQILDFIRSHIDIYAPAQPSFLEIPKWRIRNARQAFSPACSTHLATTSPGARSSSLPFYYQTELSNRLHPWSWPGWTRCQKLVRPRGWRTSCCWPTRQRPPSPAWWVNRHKSHPMITWQDLVTRHQRMGTHYPRTMHQGQLSDIVNSSLIFMVVRWGHSNNKLIFCPPVTPWTASLPPTSTRLSQGRTAISGGYMGSLSGPNSLRWCSSWMCGTCTGLLSPPFALLVWGGNYLFFHCCKMFHTHLACHLPSNGFCSGTQQLLAWKLFQKTPPISFTGWQI